MQVLAVIYLSHCVFKCSIDSAKLFLNLEKAKLLRKKLQKFVVIMTICKNKHTPKSSKLISSCLRVCNQVRENPVNRHEGSQSFCRNFCLWFPLYLTFGHPVTMKLERIKTKKIVGNEAIYVPISVQDTDVHIWNRKFGVIWGAELRIIA